MDTASVTCSIAASPVPQSRSLSQNRLPYQRMLFPVHVYIHYTETHNYPDRVEQIVAKLTGSEPFFPFPVTCTVVLASGIEPDSDLLDVYVVGGHRRYLLGIVEDGHRLPTLMEVLDTIGWAATKRTEQEAATPSLPSKKKISPRPSVASRESIEFQKLPVSGLRQVMSKARRNFRPVYDAGLIVDGQSVMYKTYD